MDLNKLDQEHALLKARHLELNDAHETTVSETRRLNDVIERLQPNLTSLKRRGDELEIELQSSQATLGELELKLASETETRRASEKARAQERSASDSEVSNLTLQIERLETRHATTSKLFEQSRSLLNEKLDELRATERVNKDMLAEKSGTDRRHASAQDEIKRLQDQVAVQGSRNTDVQERCTMLTNALAAKEAHIEQLQARHDAIRAQLADASTLHESERAATDATNRKLIEEIHSEKAERAMAQGALTIARGSREKLLLEIEDLKRHRKLRFQDAQDEDDGVTKPDVDVPKNIHKFRAVDQISDDA